MSQFLHGISTKFGNSVYIHDTIRANTTIRATWTAVFPLERLICMFLQFPLKSISSHSACSIFVTKASEVLDGTSRLYQSCLTWGWMLTTKFLCSLLMEFLQADPRCLRLLCDNEAFHVSCLLPSEWRLLSYWSDSAPHRSARASVVLCFRTITSIHLSHMLEFSVFSVKDVSPWFYSPQKNFDINFQCLMKLHKFRRTAMILCIFMFINMNVLVSSALPIVYSKWF